MKILEKIRENKKLSIIVILGFIAVCLLVASEFISDENKEETEKVKTATIEYTYSEEIEMKLTSIIMQMHGAGNTKVMVTLESSEEFVYAQNRNNNSDKSESEYILIKGDSKEGGMLLKMIAPEIRGVAVVCQGGADATVRQEITDMITSVLNISSNRVSVIKMK